MNQIQASTAGPDEAALLAVLTREAPTGSSGTPSDFDSLAAGGTLTPAALLEALSPVLSAHQAPALPGSGALSKITVRRLQLTYPDAAAAVAKSCQGLAEVLYEAGGDPDTHSLEVTSRLSLHHALAVLLTFCVMQEAWAKDKEYDAGTVAGFVAVLNAAGSPYYLRYLLSRQTMRSPELFELMRPALQPENMQLHYGHSQQHRYDALEVLFKRGQTFVDIGCGKATYLRILASRYRYAVGFEAHGPTRAEAKGILSRMKLANVKVYGGFDPEKFLPPGSHVLMTEVLEHMPKETASAMLQHLATQPAELMVFTVPNRDFNVYYGMAPGDFRHWDHHWEPSCEEFDTMMRELLGKSWTLDIYGIGDAVDGVYTGIVCLARPKKIQKKADDFAWLSDSLFTKPAPRP